MVESRPARLLNKDGRGFDRPLSNLVLSGPDDLHWRVARAV